MSEKVQGDGRHVSEWPASWASRGHSVSENGTGSLPSDCPCPPYSYAEATGAKWGAHFGRGEIFSSSILSFRCEKTKKQGGLGELDQITPPPNVLPVSGLSEEDSR